MVLPSLLARVRSGSKVVGGELDQVLLLGVVTNQVFGQIAGGGFNILLAEFEPFVAEDEGSSEDGFVDLVIAKRSLAIPCASELEPFRNGRQAFSLAPTPWRPTPQGTEAADSHEPSAWVSSPFSNSTEESRSSRCRQEFGQSATRMDRFPLCPAVGLL